MAITLIIYFSLAWLPSCTVQEPDKFLDEAEKIYLLYGELSDISFPYGKNKSDELRAYELKEKAVKREAIVFYNKFCKGQLARSESLCHSVDKVIKSFDAYFSQARKFLLFDILISLSGTKKFEEDETIELRKSFDSEYKKFGENLFVKIKAK